MTYQNQLDPGEACKARQRSTLLAHLHKGPVSTVRAREELGIGHPAGRVHELRRQGHAIVTRRACVADSQGREHVVASYVLEAGGPHA